MNNQYQKNRLSIMMNMIIVFGWLLSFPYHGPVLEGMISSTGQTGLNVSMMTVFFVAIGLLLGSWNLQNIWISKQIIMFCTGLILAISILTFFLEAKVWIMFVPMEAMLAGAIIPVHARLIKFFFTKENRNRTIANLLIFGNIILVIAHILTTVMSPTVSYFFLELLLGIAFVSSIKIKIEGDYVPTSFFSSKFMIPDRNAYKNGFTFFKSYWMLFLFIFIVSINSGLMFTIIYPYFSKYALLLSIYTNLPYIIAIYFISRIINKNKYYLLYIGLVAWGMTFILFALLAQSVISLLLIFTIMLSAAGIFDMFWASIMVDNFEHVENPSLLYGWGLSVNVLGVWTGSFMGSYMQKVNIDKYTIALIGLFVVMVLVLILVPLNNMLSDQLDYNDFIIQLNKVHKKELKDYFEEVEKSLTKREMDVFNLLIEGKTDAVISEELFISMHTIKTHNRSIYKKLKVANRVELIEKITSF